MKRILFSLMSLFFATNALAGAAVVPLNAKCTMERIQKEKNSTNSISVTVTPADFDEGKISKNSLVAVRTDKEDPSDADYSFSLNVTYVNEAQDYSGDKILDLPKSDGLSIMITEDVVVQDEYTSFDCNFSTTEKVRGKVCEETIDVDGVETFRVSCSLNY